MQLEPLLEHSVRSSFRHVRESHGGGGAVPKKAAKAKAKSKQGGKKRKTTETALAGSEAMM
eukprot:6332435-Alexandrium_andersonii.AAC.1